MQVIEALCASILVPHDHLHINHVRTFARRAPMHKNTVDHSRWTITRERVSGELRERIDR